MTAPANGGPGTQVSEDNPGLSTREPDQPDVLRRVTEGTAGAQPVRVGPRPSTPPAVPSANGVPAPQQSSLSLASQLNSLGRVLSSVGVVLGLYIMVASFLGMPAIPRYVDLAAQRVNPDMLVVPKGEARPGFMTTWVRPANSSLEMLLLAQFGAMLTLVSILGRKEGSIS